MSTTTMHEPVTAAPCPGCGDDVLLTVHENGAQLILDPDPRVGGTYEIQSDKVVRRSARAMADEWALYRKIHGGGHNVHECAPVRELHWTDR